MNIRKSQLNKLMPLINLGLLCVKSGRNWPSLRSSIGIIMICLFSIGTGCRSLTNVESVDLDLGGLEVEFYEPPPVTIIYTNAAPMKTDYKLLGLPKLMEMNGEIK